MKKLSSFSIILLAVSINLQAQWPASNPFFSTSTLPYQAPALDKIKNADIKAAMEEGMRQQLVEIAQIADNSETPTFDNTLTAFEKTGLLLQRARAVFNLLTGANSDPELLKIAEQEAPHFAANNDAIFLNGKLFKRIDALYNKRDQLNLDPESRRLLEYDEQQFDMAGAKLPDSVKTRLREINQSLASLSAQFTNHLLAANKTGALLINDTAGLAGLSKGTRDASAQAANSAGFPGKWLISLQNTTQQPDLQFLSDRNTRQRLFEASWHRAEKADSNDTRSIISRMASLRAQRAKILGFANFAAWKLQDQMAKNPDAVNEFLSHIIPAATARAKKEASEIQQIIDKTGGGFTLQPWDWNYYAEQVRKAKYALDDAEIKPYFELNTVLEKGVFYAAGQLYGLSFKERKDIPVYQPDVRVFEVFDQDNQSLALFYCDYYKRDNKSGGAWTGSLVTQSKLMNTKPVVYNVCNFPKPAPGQPDLISWTNVVTMFHEFGHALHGMFASAQYPALSGAKTARDFVEFPSQFNEHWATDPKVFAHYAIHYRTGAAMPPVLVEKINKAAGFNGGYALFELLAADKLDLQWHSLDAAQPLQNTDSFELAALRQTGLYLPEVPSRYRSTYFSHIWASGYAAGYYAYLWAEMLDDDAFSWFKAHGGLTRQNGQRFRDMILSRGNTQDLSTLFRNFYGQDPDIRPLLEFRGLVQ